MTTLRGLGAKWAPRWRQASPTGSLHPTKHIIDQKAPAFYGLSMFPYPSGMLHMGHLRVYTISDVVARFKRLRGHQVIHPMGWDAFGLPAENAAVERGIDPAIWTESNIAKMKQQMDLMLADFDWDREINTASPEFYRWTQKIFLLLFEHGLAYRKHAQINWDPVDCTVLANEQVDSEGRSWRSGAIVEKKYLEQWFIGITKYADALTKDLDLLNEWPDKVKLMQKHWIGQSPGAEITFNTTSGNILVFTTRPDTLFSVQYLAVAPTHPLVKECMSPELEQFLKKVNENEDATAKLGFKLPINAAIPITTENSLSKVFDVPVYVASYVLGDYGHGAVMGCPAHDERDYEFWKLHNGGPTKPTVKSSTEQEVYTAKEGTLFNAGSYSGKSVDEAHKLIVKALENTGSGKKSVQLRLRDWLISRQRYWGAPIPIVHCGLCGPVAVPDEQLPVLLPKVEGTHFQKGSPLGNLDEFVNTSCPSCGLPAKRDTDTMDTFMDSSWYFFRYLDSKNTEKPFDSSISKHLPVDMYIGGVEHAILHLLYTRFIAKFLGDIGLWHSDFNSEPIRKLVTQGMVQGKTFRDPSNGRVVKPEEILWSGSTPKIAASGVEPLVSFEKMSKSKFNGADPATCILEHGPDATRAHMLFQAPIGDTLNWNEEQIQGIERWLNKVLVLAEQMEFSEAPVKSKDYEAKNITINGKLFASTYLSQFEFTKYNEMAALYNGIAKSIEVDLSFNTIVSDYMKITKIIVECIKNQKSMNHPQLIADFYNKLLVVMAPVTPSVSEECWERLDPDWKSIFHERYEEMEQLKSTDKQYKIHVNGKYAGSFKGPEPLTSDTNEVLDICLQHVDARFNLDKNVKKVMVKSGIVIIIK